MQNRIVEVASDGVHLSLLRGFLKLSREGTELGRVPLPDIGGLVVRGYGVSVSLNLIGRLARENIPIVLCGADQSPASIVWPIDGHHAQGRTMCAQAALSRPAKKRLWQSVVKAKILAQAQALEAEGEEGADLRRMASLVRSGDPENVEAQAARRYWPRMIGALEDDFTRGSEGDGANRWLNYGYTVLRAGAARSILAAGLHPSFSIHHQSRGEALRLASDLMEPFRPWVDLKVRRLGRKIGGHFPELDRDLKSELVKVLSLDLDGTLGASPLQVCLDRLCQSFARICLGERSRLELPNGLVAGKGGSAE